MSGAPDRAVARRRRLPGLLLPALVNALLGLPAMGPLWLTRWALTRYLPRHCHDIADAVRPELTHCDTSRLEHAYLLLSALALSAPAMLAAVVVVNMRLAHRRRERRGLWLSSAMLVPLPFLACLALAGG